MAKYLTNKETQATLENIIMNAAKSLILVSPYISLTSTLFSRIKAAGEKGVKIKIIYRIDKVKKGELDRLKAIKNLELKFTEDLHAKCYFNEKEMIITSLNLLDSSEKNWEMGIHISRIDDKEIFDKAIRDVHTIFMDSSPLPVHEELNTGKPVISRPIKPKSNEGFCIRCRKAISFNIQKPLCPTCFNIWNRWGDDLYPENCCHFSGEESNGWTCFTFPVLNKNWKKAQKKYGINVNGL